MKGPYLLVSHDRDFLQGLTDKVYEFKDHKLKEYLGDIEYFLEQRNLQNLREAEKRTVGAATEIKNSSSGKQSYQDQKKQKSLTNRLSKIEATINKLEREIKEIDLELAINYEATIAQPNFFDFYEGKKKELEEAMKKWELVSEQLEELQ